MKPIVTLKGHDEDRQWLERLMAHLGELIPQAGEEEVGVLAVAQAEHVVAHHVPTSGFLPDFRGMKSRQIKFLRTNPIHLFAQDLHDLERDALGHRQVRIDSGAELANQAGAQQKFVRDNFGISRIFAKRGDEIL